LVSVNFSGVCPVDKEKKGEYFMKSRKEKIEEEKVEAEKIRQEVSKIYGGRVISKPANYLLL
jgi:hypothetical protein